MSALFLKILNLSINASWMILAVVFLRLILKKVPKWMTCALWAVVAFRLICPFSLETALSLLPSSEVIPQNIAMEKTPMIHSQIPALDNAVNPVMVGNLSPKVGDSANPLQVIIAVAAFVWILGMALCLIYALVSYILLKRKVRASIPLEEGVMACDDIKMPFVLGVIRPLVYVPSYLTGRTLEVVLAHEKAHIRRRDHWWKPLGFALLSVYWFNPLCLLAYILLCRDIEAACDEKVIRDQDKDYATAYSQALLDLSLQRRMITVCPLAFGETGVKQRVKAVLNYRKPSFWIITVGLIACVAMVICFATNPRKGQANEGMQVAGLEGSVMQEGNGSNTQNGSVGEGVGVNTQNGSIGEEGGSNTQNGNVGGEVGVSTQSGNAVEFAGDDSGAYLSEAEVEALLSREDAKVFPEEKWYFYSGNDVSFGEYGSYNLESRNGQYMISFYIHFYPDGTDDWYETPISSFIGMGNYCILGDELIIADVSNGMTDKRSIHRFRVEGEKLIYIGEASSNFLFVKLKDGEEFHLGQAQERFEWLGTQDGPEGNQTQSPLEENQTQDGHEGNQGQVTLPDGLSEEETAAIGLVYDFVDAVNSQNLERYISLFDEENQKEMRRFIENSGEEAFSGEDGRTILKIEKSQIPPYEKQSGEFEDAVSFRVTEVVNYGENAPRNTYELESGETVHEYVIVLEKGEWKLRRVSRQS